MAGDGLLNGMNFSFVGSDPRSSDRIAQNLEPPGTPLSLLSLPTRLVGTMDHCIDRRLQNQWTWSWFFVFLPGGEVARAGWMGA